MSDTEPPGPIAGPGDVDALGAPEVQPDPLPTRDGRRRWWRVALVSVLVLAVVAAGSIVGVAQWRKHQRAVAHERLLRNQQAYLDAVRRLDRRIAYDVAPVLRILAAMTTPRPGDLIAARDAFANKQLVTAVRSDSDAVARLDVPAGWQAHEADLRRAVGEMRDGIVGMYKDRDSEDLSFLSSDLQTVNGGMVFSGMDDWGSGVLALFIERKEKAPTDVSSAEPRRTPPTLTSWVFGVDRACIAGNVKGAPLIRQQHAGDHSTTLIRRVAGVLDDISRSVMRVPLPPQQATTIRRDVLSRMRLFEAEAKVLVQEADAIDRSDIEAARADVDRLKTIVGGLPLLASAFRKYHAIGCAGSVGPVKGHALQA